MEVGSIAVPDLCEKSAVESFAGTISSDDEHPVFCRGEAENAQRVSDVEVLESIRLSGDFSVN